MNDLAWVLSTIEDENLRDGAEAVRLSEEVCRAEGDANSSHLDTLAAAYAAVGRFDDAVRVAEKALKLTEEPGKNEINAKIKKRLEYYQSRRPWIENPHP
jgi:hypothetical protein